MKNVTKVSRVLALLEAGTGASSLLLPLQPPHRHPILHPPLLSPNPLLINGFTGATRFDLMKLSLMLTQIQMLMTADLKIVNRKEIYHYIPNILHISKETQTEYTNGATKEIIFNVKMTNLS